MNAPLPESPGAPLVSVIVPCYNTERYLREALESALAQTYRPIELIVVDDGSTDGSARVAESFGDAVRWVPRSHCGIAATRNHGVEQSRGHFLAFLDADDLWSADKTRRQMEAFEQHPEAGIVFGEVEQFVSPELAGTLERSVRFVPGVVPARMPGSGIIRRSVFQRVGGFSSELEAGEFLDWISRAEALGVRAVALPGVVLRRRIHDANHGRRRQESQGDYLKVVKSAMDRRRRAGRKPS